MHLEPLHHKIRRATAPCIITPLAQTQYANNFISVLYCSLRFHIQFIKNSLFLFRSFQFHLAHFFSKVENLRQFKSDVETAIRDLRCSLIQNQFIICLFFWVYYGDRDRDFLCSARSKNPKNPEIPGIRIWKSQNSEIPGIEIEIGIWKRTFRCQKFGINLRNFSAKF